MPRAATKPRTPPRRNGAAPRLTRAAVLRHFGCSQSELARRIGIARQWVHLWQDHKPIPMIQELRIRYELYPDVDWDKVARTKG